jgi:hypothetical protein
MSSENVVPLTDPVALSAPAWLLSGLLLLTFLLHLLAMNCLVGGSIIAVLSRFRSGDSRHRRLSSDLSSRMPSFLAATITLGIAPLLFVQVLYGQFFYTSSVLIAWPWFSVIILLTLAYYGTYAVAFRATENRSVVRWIGITALLLLLLIGFIYTNNFTLMLTPEVWRATYLADPTGMNLNLSEKQLLPRFLHTMVAAAAIGGLLVVVLGLFRWRDEREYGLFLVKHGAYWFIGSTMTQFMVGILFMITLPMGTMRLFLGSHTSGTVLFAISIVATLAAVFAMLTAIRQRSPHRMVTVSLILTAVVMVAMVLMRDIVRSAYLNPYFSPASLAVEPRWGIVSLFLVLFSVALVLWGIMLKKYFFARLGTGVS